MDKSVYTMDGLSSQRDWQVKQGHIKPKIPNASIFEKNLLRPAVPICHGPHRQMKKVEKKGIDEYVTKDS